MKYQAKTEIQELLSDADRLYLELAENDTLSRWRQEMTSGNEAFRQNKPGLALHFFEKATGIAEGMLTSSLERNLYPDSALTALSQAKRNIAEIYLRMGQLERAVSLKESFFDQLCDTDLDAGSFMWDFHRTLQVDELPDGQTIFCVMFSDVAEANKWWLVARREAVDLCNDDPGYEVDAYITSPLAVLADVWVGLTDLRAQLKSQQILMTGERQIVNSAERWFPRSMYKEVIGDIVAGTD